MENESGLIELRKRWERGMVPQVVLDRSKTDLNVLVVLSNGRGYDCHRYFILGDSWECSVDGSGVPLEAVFSWLNKPSAMTTKPDHYVKPTDLTETAYALQKRR